MIKPILLWLLFFLAFVECLIAQDNEAIDSLKNILKKNIGDIEKVDVWNQLLQEYNTTDYYESSHYYNKAVTLSQKIKYAAGESLAYSKIAWAESIINAEYEKSKSFF